MLNGLKTRVSRFREASANLLARKDMYYVVEPADWVIKDVGRNITRRMRDLPSRITTVTTGIRDSIVHFGSINTFADQAKPLVMHPSNRIIVTWFHVVEGDSRLGNTGKLGEGVRLWHTACNLTRDKLVAAGIPEGRIKVIPLGVDLDAFRPRDLDFRGQVRAKLGIPDDRVVIGSFQKDGNGWGDGKEPKLIKGPDLFCRAVEVLAKKIKVTVLLTGPARGYVKERLRAVGIPFVHTFFENPKEVSEYYQALDLYIVSSREEGGPMQILESMASGVPLVSTSVGMAPDIIVDGKNGFLVPLARVEDIPGLCMEILKDGKLREGLVANGLETASRFGWDTVAKMYFERIYKELS